MTAVLQMEEPPKTGKPSPATQMREMLSVSRRHGVPFEKAWRSAFQRVRWPHDTEHRQGWKDQLEEDRSDWQAAYEGDGEVNRPLIALYSLFCAYVPEHERIAA